MVQGRCDRATQMQEYVNFIFKRFPYPMVIQEPKYFDLFSNETSGQRAVADSRFWKSRKN